MQEHDHKKSGWGVLTTMVVMLFFLLLLYILSSGPVAWLYVNMGWDKDSWYTIYSPIHWTIATISNDILNPWYEWYVKLFIN